jgi:hypothetical protein
MSSTPPPDGSDGPGGGPMMKRWLVWLIVGGPVLAFVLGKLLAGS